MFETKTTVLPSGDQPESPIWRVMYRRSRERLSSPCSTFASGFAVICLGSVIAFGGVRVCETASVLISTTIANGGSWLIDICSGHPFTSPDLRMISVQQDGGGLPLYRKLSRSQSDQLPRHRNLKRRQTGGAIVGYNNPI